jgi:putative DNA primase/helicase
VTERLEILPEHNELSVLESALALAKWGLPVFPLRPRSKLPATSRGFKDASRNPAVIREWWGRNPRYGVAIATGHRVAVLDVDTVEGHGADGPDTLGRLEREHGALPRTPESLTPTGGRHVWFLAPPGTKTRPGFA